MSVTAHGQAPIVRPSSRSTTPEHENIEALLRTIGKRVRLLRLTRELTQEELAHAANMSRSFISLIEHGAHGIDIIRLYNLAAALEVSLAELLQPPPEPEKTSVHSF